MKREIILLGGSGFVGSHLVETLLNNDDYSVSMLVHKKQPKLPVSSKDVRLVEGSFFNEDSLDELITPGSTVVNLAFLKNAPDSQNINGLGNILAVCCRKKINRFIHISTANVVGRTDEVIIDENVADLPFSSYDKVKKELEVLVLSKFGNSSIDAVILRPTAVFGSGGENGLQHLTELVQCRSVKSYLKASLYNTRRYNLVPVSYLVSAIIFLVTKQCAKKQNIFLVSADDEKENNYLSVDQSFRKVLGLKNYSIPILRVPEIILSIILRMAGRSNIRPSRVYLSERLRQLGWNAPEQFNDAIVSFAKGIEINKE